MDDTDEDVRKTTMIKGRDKISPTVSTTSLDKQNVVVSTEMGYR